MAAQNRPLKSDDKRLRVFVKRRRRNNHWPTSNLIGYPGDD